MAALTRAEKDNHPTSTPNSPRQRGHGRGWMDRSTLGCPTSHNDWTGAGTDCLSLKCICQTWHRDHHYWRSGTKHTRVTGGTSNRKDPVPSNSSGAKVGATWLGMCHPGDLTPIWGGTEGMWPIPPTSTSLQQPTVGTQHSLPDPEPNHNKGGSKERTARGLPLFLPQPLTQLLT